MTGVILFQQQEKWIKRLGEGQMTIALTIIVVLPGSHMVEVLLHGLIFQNIILFFCVSLFFSKTSFLKLRAQPRPAAVPEPVIDLGLQWDGILSCPVVLA
jgi:hypothetical protein